MLREFKEFALKGNVVDLAVGLMIGAAFGNIVSSLVNDILMPPIGLLLGNVDFSNLFISLSGTTYASLKEAQAAGAPTINYGLFINTVINFLLVALALYFVVRAINRFRKEPVPIEPNSKECPYCLSTIPINATRCAHCTSELQ